MTSQWVFAEITVLDVESAKPFARFETRGRVKMTGNRLVFQDKDRQEVFSFDPEVLIETACARRRRWSTTASTSRRSSSTCDKPSQDEIRASLHVENGSVYQ